MSKTALTRTAVRLLPAPPPGLDKMRHFDDRLPGFFAERRRDGVTFYFRYRDKRGRRPEIRLGHLGDVTVDQARKRAEELRAQVSLGGDPAADDRRLKAVPTLAAFADRDFLPFVRERLRSFKNYEVALRSRLLPMLGRRALDEITPADVAEVRRRLAVDGLANGTVNRHLALLRRMLNLAVKWQILDGRNPAASPGMLPERHRDRFLTPEQARAFVRALDGDPWRDAANALALLLFTGARKQEVLTARWDLVDLKTGFLHVQLSKSGRPRAVPLSPAAVQVLERQAARRVEGNPHVFPSRVAEGKPIVAVQNAWERARDRAGLPRDLRVHDLRHTLASALANAGTPLSEIGAVLGHSQLSTTARYAHHSPDRLVATATAAAGAWDLLPAPRPVEGVED